MTEESEQSEKQELDSLDHSSPHIGNVTGKQKGNFAFSEKNKKIKALTNSSPVDNCERFPH